jgi:hypothetical protein
VAVFWVAKYLVGSDDKTHSPTCISVRSCLICEQFSFSSSSEASCWLRTADRQAARMRGMYLRATLRQDVGFFDTAGAGVAEVVNSVSTDTMAIQEAIGEKVGQHSFFFFFFFCFFILFFFPTSYFLLHESNKAIQCLNVDDILEFVSTDVGKSR